MTNSPDGFDTVLVVDFGAQYAQLIARRVRECRVFSEIVPSTMPLADMLAKRAKAIGHSPLDEIPSVGARRKQALLHHFGSARAVARCLALRDSVGT